MTIDLDAETAQRIQQQVDLGHYADAEQVVAHAMALLAEEESWLEHNRDAIDQKLQHSHEQAQRGELLTLEEARERISSLRLQPAG